MKSEFLEQLRLATRWNHRKCNEVHLEPGKGRKLLQKENMQTHFYFKKLRKRPQTVIKSLQLDAQY